MITTSGSSRRWDAGPWGVLVFVAVMTATVAVGVPGIVFVAPVVACGRPRPPYRPSWPVV